MNNKALTLRHERISRRDLLLFYSHKDTVTVTSVSWSTNPLIIDNMISFLLGLHDEVPQRRSEAIGYLWF